MRNFYTSETKKNKRRKLHEFDFLQDAFDAAPGILEDKEFEHIYKIIKLKVIDSSHPEVFTLSDNHIEAEFFYGLEHVLDRDFQVPVDEILLDQTVSVVGLVREIVDKDSYKMRGVKILKGPRVRVLKSGYKIAF